MELGKQGKKKSWPYLTSGLFCILLGWGLMYYLGQTPPSALEVGNLPTQSDGAVIVPSDVSSTSGASQVTFKKPASATGTRTATPIATQFGRCIPRTRWPAPGRYGT